ncbi:hypothetical protein [Nocardia sp. NBC_00403]|uniref:hypothetical protein n=1 Tax=Nocardia sp. NBC_00403 TaxID=2975990 RepID=UPI002E223AE3
MPEAKIEGMRRAADGWSDSANGLTLVLAELVKSQERALKAASDGVTADAIRTQYPELIDDTQRLIDHSNSMAKQLYEGATALELEIYMVRGIAMVLAAQLAIDLLMGPAGLAKAATDRAVGETAMKVAWRELLMQLRLLMARFAAQRPLLAIVIRSAVIGGVSMAGVRAVAEGIQVLHGDRKAVDWKAVGIAGAAGFAGGAAGAVVGAYVAPAVGRLGANAVSQTGQKAWLLGSVLTAAVFAGGFGGLIGGLTAEALTLGKIEGRNLADMILMGVGGGLLGGVGAAVRGIRAGGYSGASVARNGRGPAPVNLVSRAEPIPLRTEQPRTGSVDGHLARPDNLTTPEMVALGRELSDNVARDLDLTTMEPGSARDRAAEFLDSHGRPADEGKPKFDLDNLRIPTADELQRMAHAEALGQPRPHNPEAGSAPPSKGTGQQPGSARDPVPTPPTQHPPPGTPRSPLGHGPIHPAVVTARGGNAVGTVFAPERVVIRQSGPTGPTYAVEPGVARTGPDMRVEAPASQRDAPLASTHTTEPGVRVDEGKVVAGPEEAGGVATADEVRAPVSEEAPVAESTGLLDDSPSQSGQDATGAPPDGTHGESPLMHDGDSEFVPAHVVDDGMRNCAPEAGSYVKAQTKNDAIDLSVIGDRPAGAKGVSGDQVARGLRGDWLTYASPRALVEHAQRIKGTIFAGVQFKDAGAHAFGVGKNAQGRVEVHEQVGNVVRRMSGDQVEEWTVDAQGQRVGEIRTREVKDAVGQFLDELTPLVESTHGVGFGADNKAEVPLEPGQAPTGRGPRDEMGHRPTGGADVLERPATATDHNDPVRVELEFLQSKSAFDEALAQILGEGVSEAAPSVPPPPLDATSPAAPTPDLVSEQAPPPTSPSRPQGDDLAPQSHPQLTAPDAPSQRPVVETSNPAAHTATPRTAPSTPSPIPPHPTPEAHVPAASPKAASDHTSAPATAETNSPTAPAVTPRPTGDHTPSVPPKPIPDQALSTPDDHASNAKIPGPQANPNRPVSNPEPQAAPQPATQVDTPKAAPTASQFSTEVSNHIAAQSIMPGANSDVRPLTTVRVPPGITDPTPGPSNTLGAMVARQGSDDEYPEVPEEFPETSTTIPDIRPTFVPDPNDREFPDLPSESPEDVPIPKSDIPTPGLPHTPEMDRPDNGTAIPRLPALSPTPLTDTPTAPRSPTPAEHVGPNSPVSPWTGKPPPEFTAPAHSPEPPLPRLPAVPAFSPTPDETHPKENLGAPADPKILPVFDPDDLDYNPESNGIPHIESPPSRQRIEQDSRPVAPRRPVPWTKVTMGGDSHAEGGEPQQKPVTPTRAVAENSTPAPDPAPPENAAEPVSGSTAPSPPPTPTPADLAEFLAAKREHERAASAAADLDRPIPDEELGWRQLRMGIELELGVRAYNLKSTRAAAIAVLDRIEALLYILHPDATIEEIQDAFYAVNDKTETGRVPRSVSLDTLRRSGNLRELVLAGINAMYQSSATNPSVSTTLDQGLARLLNQTGWEEIAESLGLNVTALSAIKARVAAEAELAGQPVPDIEAGDLRLARFLVEEGALAAEFRRSEAARKRRSTDDTDNMARRRSLNLHEYKLFKPLSDDEMKVFEGELRLLRKEILDPGFPLPRDPETGLVDAAALEATLRANDSTVAYVVPQYRYGTREHLRDDAGYAVVERVVVHFDEGLIDPETAMSVDPRQKVVELTTIQGVAVWEFDKSSEWFLDVAVERKIGAGAGVSGTNLRATAHGDILGLPEHLRHLYALAVFAYVVPEHHSVYEAVQGIRLGGYQLVDEADFPSLGGRDLAALYRALDRLITAAERAEGAEPIDFTSPPVADSIRPAKTYYPTGDAITDTHGGRGSRGDHITQIDRRSSTKNSFLSEGAMTYFTPPDSVPGIGSKRQPFAPNTNTDPTSQPQARTDDAQSGQAPIVVDPTTAAADLHAAAAKVAAFIGVHPELLVERPEALLNGVDRLQDAVSVMDEQQLRSVAGQDRRLLQLLPLIGLGATWSTQMAEVLTQMTLPEDFWQLHERSNRLNAAVTSVLELSEPAPPGAAMPTDDLLFGVRRLAAQANSVPELAEFVEAASRFVDLAFSGANVASRPGRPGVLEMSSEAVRLLAAQAWSKAPPLTRPDSAYRRSILLEIQHWWRYLSPAEQETVTQAHPEAFDK